MISIIICSREPNLDTKLKANIEATIGVEYEIIFINNSQNLYTIFQAYNLGVSQSKYETLCFMHDDIHILTHDWGNIVLESYYDEKVGAIGIAGSPYVSWMPGTWWSAGINAQNVIQGDIKVTEYFEHLNIRKFSEVLLLDGVWFCIRKKLFQKIRFDEMSYQGFHMYDMDICMQIHQQKFKCLSLYNIDINHESQGVLNNPWIKNRIQFRKKWKHLLPLSNLKLTWYQIAIYEWRNTLAFLKIKMKN